MATRVTLLDGFGVACDGVPQALPPGAQRLVAFLALHERPLLRAHVAGRLWPTTTQDNAYANLRSSIWRSRCPGGPLVVASRTHVELASSVEVDATEQAALAQRAVDRGAPAPAAVPRLLLEGDLLPDWYDEWAQHDRERLRQLRLHALEALADRLVLDRRFAEAADAALAALGAEPLRESAHRALIRVHAAEGNVSEALRQYHRCRDLLARRLGLGPSPELERLIADLPGRGAPLRLAAGR